MAIILITSLLIILILIWKIISNHFNYWENKGLKSVIPSNVFFQCRVLLKKSFYEFVIDVYNKGKGESFSGIYEGFSRNLWVRDPDMIRIILTKDFDHFMDRPVFKFNTSPYVNKMMIFLEQSEWKNVRHSVAPAFSTGRIRGMFELVQQCSDNLIDYIKFNESNNFDVKDLFGMFTLDVVATTAFGVESNSFKNENNELIVKMKAMSNISMFTRFLLLASIIFHLPKCVTQYLPVSFMNEDTISFLSGIIKETMRRRKEENVRRNDFLQLIMDAQLETEGKVSEEIAIAQAILIFVAGYETSSILLTLTVYSLAMNKNVQDKLRKEILDKTQVEFTHEIVNDMPYLDMVFAEALRIYPPAPRLDRVCTKAFKLGNLDLEIGSKVSIPVAGIHLDPELYPEPEKFLPERFEKDAKSNRHPFSYLPFGQGPRNCIGLRFAQMSTKVCMVNLLKNFSFEINDKTEIPLKYNKKSMLIKTENAVFISIKPLKN